MTPERLADIRHWDGKIELAWDADANDMFSELLAEVDRLTAANSDLEQYVKTYCPTPFEKSEADRLTKENARLRAQVAAAHRPTDPTHGRGGKTICSCGELSWPCPALASEVTEGFCVCEALRPARDCGIAEHRHAALASDKADA